MTSSTGCYYNPMDGSSSVIVPPGSLKYVGSSISDPEAEDYVWAKTYDVEVIEPPEGANSGSDVSEGSDQESEQDSQE